MTISHTKSLRFPGRCATLVAAIRSGAKTATTSLILGYVRDDEPLPQVGDRSAVVDSQDRPVAAIEVTAVRVIRLAEVDRQHAVDEGEGHTSVAQWRADHEEFRHSPELRAELADPTFTVDDDTMVVATRFRLVTA